VLFCNASAKFKLPREDVRALLIAGIRWEPRQPIFLLGNEVIFKSKFTETAFELIEKVGEAQQLWKRSASWLFEGS
jgi:hypothetical protein